MSAQRGLQSPVRTPGLKVTAIPFHITDSSGTPTCTAEIGAESILSITDNGTGDCTITLKTPAARAIIAGGMVADVARLSPQVVSRTTSAIRIKWTTDAGSASDTGFSGVLYVSDDIVLRG